MKAVIVYCAKQIVNGDPVLVPSYVGFRAREIRASVGRMYNDKNSEAGWKMAMKNGWRVEPCVIEAQKDWLRRERR